MRVEILPYTSQWALDFQTIKSELESSLTGVEIISIEHVGSTSVPGLAAKPLIDVDVIVTSENLEPASVALTERGGYQNMGTWGVPGRVAFRKADAVPKRNLYVCVEGCVALRNHLALRDVCRNDNGLRDLYGEVKLRLAMKEWSDVDEYCVAKNEILQLILERAGLSEPDLKEIASQNES